MHTLAHLRAYIHTYLLAAYSIKKKRRKEKKLYNEENSLEKAARVHRYSSLKT